MIREILRSTVGHVRGRVGLEGEGAAAIPHLQSVPPGDGQPLPWVAAPPGPWSLERAYQYCEEFARQHHESFPVASRFVPNELRKHVLAVYAFARAADDFADEPVYEGRRDEALDAWELELERCFHGEATHPLFIALHDTIEKRDLPMPALRDLLGAFRVDMQVKRYPTFNSLRGYTARSAEPVGRVVLALFGYRAPELVRFADEIATALQLTNFWQDVAADAARDHIYLPAEDLHFFGLAEADVKKLVPTRALRDLLRFQVARTRMLFEHGRPLLQQVGMDLRLELTVIWLLGMSILDKIEAAGYDVFSRRIHVRRRDQAMVLARAARTWALDLDVSALRRLWP